MDAALNRDSSRSDGRGLLCFSLLLWLVWEDYCFFNVFVVLLSKFSWGNIQASLAPAVHSHGLLILETMVSVLAWVPLMYVELILIDRI